MKIQPDRGPVATLFFGAIGLIAFSFAAVVGGIVAIAPWAILGWIVWFLCQP